MRRSWTLALAIALVGILVLGAGGPVAAQAPGSEGAAASTPDADSLAEAFFISRRAHPGGEKSVELLGSAIIWLLLALSVLSIGLIGVMAATNQRKGIIPDGVVQEVRMLLRSGQYREALELTRTDESYFSKVMYAGLREANHGFSAVIRSLEQTADELTTNRLRKIEYLNILGQVSPMIGLFGTVYGMILAFQAIVASGGDANPIQLAGGIGTALTTTFWGLVVAIPALAGYAIIRNKIDELTTEGTLAAEELLNQFRPRTRNASAAPKQSSPAV